MLIVTHTCLRKSKSYVDTRCFTVNTPHSPFAVGKTMETFHSGMSAYVKSCTRTRPRKSKWCRVVSWWVVLVVVVSLLRGQSFFMVSLHGHRAQSSAVVRNWLKGCAHLPSLSPGVRGRVRVRVKVSDLVLEHEVFRGGSQSGYEQNPPHCNCHRRNFIEVIKVPRWSAG